MDTIEKFLPVPVSIRLIKQKLIICMPFVHYSLTSILSVKADIRKKIKGNKDNQKKISSEIEYSLTSIFSVWRIVKSDIEQGEMEKKKDSTRKISRVNWNIF